MNFLKKFFGTAEDNAEEELQEQQAKDFDILKYDGIAALKQHQPAYAVKCFRRALELKEDLEIRDYLWQALVRDNQMAAAYEQLCKLSEAQPENVAIWLSMADVAYLMEDYEAMTKACQKAENVAQDDPRVHFTYAKALIGRKELAEAVSRLTQTIELSAGRPFGEAHLLRAQTWFNMGETDKAEEAADELMTEMQDWEEVLLLKARCLERREMHTEAVKAYGKVLEDDPFQIDAFKERAAIRRALGDEQGAQEDERRLQELMSREVDESESAGKEQDIQAKVEQAYKTVDPFGLGGIKAD